MHKVPELRLRNPIDLIKTYLFLLIFDDDLVIPWKFSIECGAVLRVDVCVFYRLLLLLVRFVFARPRSFVTAEVHAVRRQVTKVVAAVHLSRLGLVLWERKIWVMIQSLSRVRNLLGSDTGQQD